MIARLLPATVVSLASLALAAQPTTTTTAPSTQPLITIDYDAMTDPKLQSTLEAIDVDLRKQFDMTPEQTSVGLVDLQTRRVAMLRPDHELYAASLAKIGILLAYFTLTPDAVTNLDAATRHDLGLMAKQSNNEMATKFSKQLGIRSIQNVLDDAGFYDATRGGGIWFGKHYGKGDERYGSPVGNNSHAATVRMLLRYFVMLEQDQLVSPAASQTMREIFRSSDLAPTDNFFVHSLKDRPGLTLYRKWGLWQNSHHDVAVITAPGRHYVLAAMTEHARGDAYLAALATRVDDAMQK